MESYRLEGQTFVIDDYDRKPAFSSFLPGLAGVKGTEREDQRSGKTAECVL